MARNFPPGTIPARGFDWDRVLYPPRRVGDFADLSYGKSLVEGKRKPGSVPVYGTNGPCGWTNEGLKPGPGVILGRKGQGPLGVEWCDGPFWVIDTAYFASVTGDVDLKWFYYVVKYVGLNHLKSGEKPGLQRDTFRAQLFPFPEKDVQAEIALVLSALDAKIASNRSVNATLEDFSSALFNSWFSDFDPVVAKRDCKAPVGVPVAVTNLFPNHFEESELGPIPKGWSAARVGAYFDVTMGQSPPGSTYNEIGDGQPFYQGRTDFGFRYPRRRVYCTAPTRFAKPGDTLISVRAPVGDVNMAIEPCAIGRGVAAVRHKGNKPSFTYYAMRSLRDEFDVYEGEGTLFGAIGGDDLRRVPFVHPTDQVLEAFEGLIGPTDALIESNEHETARLAKLRDSVLGPLLSGELTLKTAENAVGAAL